ncbi:hypothetical protein P7B02_04095 [Caulobacter segnis]|uniref:hypothetical protein n=1 Tax=Caulobacter segnis TaxID=88688 RepID=UPI00240F59D5|nr:hypothetical protein [Caulobacter segnis]MDG2520714.1 hypothetical protein [Caulobacter segnis]
MLETIAPRITPVVALAASALVLTACQKEEAAPPPPVQPPVIDTPPIKAAASPPYDRARLLEAMDAAAAAYAAGESKPDDLAGKQFVVRQAFGCEEAPPLAADAPGDGLGRWSWSERRDVIRVSVSPGDWAKSALMAGGAENWEAVEGFWLTRPWLRSEGCPGVKADPLASGPAAPTPQTIAIAAVFEAGGSRIGRRNGRSYDFSVRGEGGPPTPPVGGYRLVLEGRFAAFSTGAAIRCRSQSSDQRPVCVAAASVDRVAFEDAQGQVLSEWRPG